MFSFFRLRVREGFPFLPVALVLAIFSFGFLQLYSAGGGMQPWALPQLLRFGGACLLFFIVAFVDLRFWLASAAVFYVVGLLLLVLVELLGATGMGAKRWINLYVMQLQPSEVMKFALVLFLASYFHLLGEKGGRIRSTFVPLLAIGVSALLVLRQPDLGTAIILIASGLTILFVAGVSWWFFIGGGTFLLGLMPILWHYLKPYQKKRIFTFLNPEADPLGAGYHTLQSKIAIGSGGLWGKGFGGGTQVQLSFLPEKQTDFIFTVLCEEWGFWGAGLLIFLYLGLVFYGYWVALHCHARFTKLLVVGTTSTLFAHVFVNIGMVMGVLPIVGVPLPLMSYGGTALLTFMGGVGWLVAADRQRRVRLPLSGME